MDTPSDAPFEAWLARADAVCCKLVGMSIYDLPDYCYRDAFDDGMTPAAAAKSALRAAGWED